MEKHQVFPYLRISWVESEFIIFLLLKKTKHMPSDYLYVQVQYIRSSFTAFCLRFY